MKLIFQIYFSSSDILPINKSVELRLEKLIGHGGYGKIYKINENYVVKCFYNSSMDNNEYNIAKYLNSIKKNDYPKNLLYPIAGGLDKFNNKYIIYPLCNKINFNEINITKFIKNITNIQLFLNNKINSLYLDLKPANIMMFENDFSIIDLGGIINLKKKNNNLIYNLNYNKNEHIGVYQLVILLLFIISKKSDIRDLIKLSNENKIKIINDSIISNNLKKIISKIIMYEVDFILLNKMLQII